MSRFAFAAALLWASPVAADVNYFATIEDLPMPPGFAEQAPAQEFAGAGGRIVLGFAAGELSGLEVRDFYYENLPQLGWSVSPQPDGVLVFQRGRERLSFALEREDGRTELGVQLAILPAAMNAH